MCKPPIGRLLLATIISLGLTACGTGKVGSAPVAPVVPAPAQSPPTTLTGNWFLAGSRVPASYPIISTSLYVQGNIVTGEAAFAVQCTGAGIPAATSSATVAINGMIASNGTFQASTGTVGVPALGTISLSLTGNSPQSAAPSVWTGTYSVASTTGSNGAGCSTSQTATFAATAIMSMTGTYIGLPANTASPFGSGSTVTVQITQGAPTSITRGGTSTYIIPLTANLAITNTLCPFSGSTTGVSEPSSLRGDSFALFLTPGFPYGVLSGTFNDPTAGAFSGDLTSLSNVNGCPGIALYNFTRK